MTNFDLKTKIMTLKPKLYLLISILKCWNVMNNATNNYLNQLFYFIFIELILIWMIVEWKCADTRSAMPATGPSIHRVTPVSIRRGATARGWYRRHRANACSSPSPSCSWNITTTAHSTTSPYVQYNLFNNFF